MAPVGPTNEGQEQGARGGGALAGPGGRSWGGDQGVTNRGPGPPGGSTREPLVGGQTQGLPAAWGSKDGGTEVSVISTGPGLDCDKLQPPDTSAIKVAPNVQLPNYRRRLSLGHNHMFTEGKVKVKKKKNIYEKITGYVLILVQILV